MVESKRSALAWIVAATFSAVIPSSGTSTVAVIPFAVVKLYVYFFLKFPVGEMAEPSMTPLTVYFVANFDSLL